MKPGTWLKSAIAIFAAVMLAQLAYLAARFFSGVVFSLPYLVWLGAVLLLSLIGALVVLLYRKRIWVHDPVAVELRALRLAAAKQFRQARSRARIIDRNPMGVPWYFSSPWRKRRDRP